MSRFSDVVIKHRKTVIAIFLIFAVLSVIFIPAVSVNYNMVDYLPSDAQSTAAISVMKEEFGGEMPNARIMISNVTIREALEFKDKIASTDGVESVTWLDDVVGRETLCTTPAEYLDRTLLENYYKDGNALYSVAIENGAEKETVAAIRDLIGEGNAVGGGAVNTAAAQQMSVTEVLKAMAILIPVIIVILILSTSSWIEPLLFIGAIGIAVVINMGSNVFFGEVSFITQTVSPILQLAVSLDYAIFLLHGFNSYRETYEPEEAMRRAVKKALSAIAASAATTVIGFLALAFMRFRIGPDLGINLVKGVALSFISVVVFLPALTLSCYRLIDRTRHRRLIPDFKGVGRKLAKISLPFLLAAVVIAVPCYLAQKSISFIYGTGGVVEASRAGRDEALIEAEFGKDNALVLLVRKGDAGKETELCGELSRMPHVKSVVSYAASVGSEIPAEYVGAEVQKEFYSENYARIILYTDTDAEGTEAFETVAAVKDTAAKYYGGCYLAGQSATLYDMKSIVSTDTETVNLSAIIGIFVVLLLTYRSLAAPFLLIFTIESAIWLNLSIAYFSGKAFSFIGYLVISTVQLGSTVDYAILLTDRYLGNRKTLSKKEAIGKALGDNLIAILISAVILSSAGFILAATSSNRIISELGVLLGRGTLLSFLMVVCVLPALLGLFDRAIRATTLKKRGPIEKQLNKICETANKQSEKGDDQK